VHGKKGFEKALKADTMSAAKTDNALAESLGVFIFT
jgi:hypothetical protein